MVNKTRKFKHNPSEFVSYLDKLIHEGHLCNIVLRSLNIAQFGISIDSLLILLNQNNFSQYFVKVLLYMLSTIFIFGTRTILGFLWLLMVFLH